MGKGYILVNVPDKCIDCRFCDEVLEGIVAYCELEDDPKVDELIREIDVNYTRKKPDWCPIQGFPKEMEVCGKYPQPGKPMPSYRLGWNDCLKTIINADQEERDNAKEV